jgi:Outer membrane protein beta-barrel domain
MKKCLIFTLTMLATSLFAQKDETLIGKTGLRLTGLWGGSNIGLVGFDGDNSGMGGGFLGLEFNKSLTLGYCGAGTDGATNYNGQLRKFDLSYGGFLIGYAYRPQKVVHPRVSFLMGSGNLKFNDEPKDQIFVVQPSAGLEVNLFRWFRMGMEGGYRFVSNTSLPKPSDKDVSDAFVQLSFRFGWSWGKD